MTFNPNEHMSKLKGKDYLEVKWRLVWFRQEHPDWWIETELVEHDAEAGRAVIKATVGAPSGDTNANAARTRATGYKQETRKDFPDYLEKAETGAIGRALAGLGYGTQFAPELEEGERLSDSPVARSGHTPLRERDVTDTPRYTCWDCAALILTNEGRHITEAEARIITDRFGKLVCKEHRPKAALVVR